MKVMHLVTGLLRGGAETMLARLVPHLDLSSIVVSMMDEGPLGAELKKAGIPVYTLRMHRGLPSITGLWKLNNIIRSERPDILQTWLYHADLAGLLISFLHSSMPLVWNVQCSNFDPAEGSRKIKMLQKILARASRAPDAIIVNSECGMQHHATLGYSPKQWEFIPNGCDTDIFRPDPTTRAKLRCELDIRDDDILVGMAARVHPQKDYHNFLAAAERIAATRSDAKFILIGKDTDKLEFSKTLRGRLFALGEVANLARCLPALDVFVLSSAFGEGTPNVVLEAMSCGVPCVVTDVGDSAAIVGHTGIIVPPRNAEALSNGIREMIARRTLARIAARQRIIDFYSLASVTSQYRRLYESLRQPTKW